MRYRVDELASACGVSVDTVRFYQAKSLLPPGEREGRIVWYSDEHRRRLARIRELKDKGFSLATISRLLAGELDAADEALAAALAGALAGTSGTSADEDRYFTLAEFSEQTGIPEALIQVIERQGLLIGSEPAGPAEGAGDGAREAGEAERRYTPADVEAAAAGLALLEAGLPLDELLSLAKQHDQSARATAERAVELFDAYVRAPIRARAQSDAEAAEALVEAFRRLLPATTSLVAHHFQQVLLATARARFEGPVADESAIHEAAGGES